MDAKKQEKLRGLKFLEKKFVYFLLQDENKDRKIDDFNELLGCTADNVHTLLTKIYKSLNVIGWDNEKRDILIREYKEDFQFLYPNLESIIKEEEDRKSKKKQPNNPSSNSGNSSNTLPNETSQGKNTGRKIDVDPPERRTNPIIVIIGILAGFVLISVIVIVVLLNTIRALNRTDNSQPPANPVFPTSTFAPSVLPTDLPLVATDIPTETGTPTNTTIPPTATPTPTITPSPTPAITLPFSDNFDNGVSPLWQTIGGTWLISNGRWTDLPKDDNAEVFDFNLLPDPKVKNFRISTTVYTETSQGYLPMLGIVIRAPSGNNGYLAFYMRNNESYFAILGNDYNNVEALVGKTEIGVSSGAKVTVDVVGNTYTAKINGREVQNITLSGWESGDVGIMDICWFKPPCPSFDNFSIEPLP